MEMKSEIRSLFRSMDLNVRSACQLHVMYTDILHTGRSYRNSVFICRTTEPSVL